MITHLDLLKELNITKNDTLIVSVSGGVDSVVLLNLLVNAGYKPIVVHFNHQTRANNALEEALVVELAEKYNLVYYIFNFEYSGKKNFQAEARLFRQNNLKNVASRFDSAYILTAHHLDDLAETILMKITRGSNLYGYSGIQKVTKQDGYIYLKPLLDFSKNDIINYANVNKLKYLTDESNLESHYLRNRYRHAIIPIMKQENSNLLNQFKEYSNILIENFNFIRKYASKFVDIDQVDISELIKEDDVIIKEVIIILLEKNQVEINNNLVADLLNIIKSNSPNATYNLSNRMSFIKSYSIIKIIKNVATTTYNIVLNHDVNILPNMKKITLLNNVSDNTNNTIVLCYNNIRLPLIARTRLAGDKLDFDFGTKKLKDYLIDLKIPMTERNNLTIITDSNNTIMWVENIYINKTLGNQNKITFKWEIN